MKKFGKIVLVLAGVFLVYGLVTRYFNMPIFGGSLVFLLVLVCPLMFLFMDHSGHKEHKD